MRYLSLLRAILSFATLLGLVSPLRAAEAAEAAEEAEVVEMPVDTENMDVGKLKPMERQAPAEIAAASNEGELALKRMQLPPGLTASLWAAEPMLANPVAFNFDERGRIFVAETYRYRSSVLDIRDYMWTLEDDLANRTIADQSASFLKHFGPEGVKQLSIESERVRLLEDTNHDGKADRSTLFAEGFASALDGIGSGVLARRGKVYFTNIPSLWLLEGETRAGAAGKRTELSRGYGVRFNFTGHDLHGLAFGPDGKLYFSVGDRGAHAVAKDGSTADSPDTGSVFRCNPDGTQLEIFATGLRNPQSLLFNEYGDLFTGDNDSDQGDEERLVHLVEGGDSGWRIGYQHAPLGKAGPWNLEKLWLPRFSEQPTYHLPPICNIEDGPSGIAYYPGTGLNENYRGSIFITHFKGSIARSGIYSYNVKPSGASYAIADSKPFLTSALPTDVKFGPDGKLYYSDWAEGWPKSKKGRIYAISDPAHVNDPLVKETQQIIASDFRKKTADEVAALLAHPDWRVRLEAQFELAERDGGLLAFSHVVTDGKAHPLARRHALWGLGQLAERRPEALALIRQMILDEDAELRAQAAKLLGDHHAGDAGLALVAALNDMSPRVRFFAARSLGKLGNAEAVPPLLTLLRDNNDEDAYIRHAAVLGLVGSGNLAALTAASSSPYPAVRLGVLLALRRLGRAEVARFLDDREPLLVAEAARAINDAPVNDALPALAAFIAKRSSLARLPGANSAPVVPDASPSTGTPATTVANVSASAREDVFMLRVLNANFRLGTPATAAALATYAAQAEAPAPLRAEALLHLANWAKPPARDRVVGIYRPLTPATRESSVAVQALVPVIPTLLAAATPETVQLATLAAIKSLDLKTVSAALYSVVADDTQSAVTRAEALRSLEHFKDSRLADAVRLAASSDSSSLRRAALPIAAGLSPDAAAPLLANLVAHGTQPEQKAAFRALGPLKHPSADALFAEQLQLLADGKVAPSTQLELLEAAAKRDDPAVKKRLAAREAQLAKSGDELAAYRVALAGGNAERGRRLFNEHPVLACVRCHRTGNEGGDAGPNLAGVGGTYSREYLLQSIVKPSAKIAAGFETATITLKSGAVRVGTIAAENETTLTLKLAEQASEQIAKTDIAKRETAPSSMPEIFGQILTKSELRDLVEFLSSLKNPPVIPATTTSPLRALRNLRN